MKNTEKMEKMEVVEAIHELGKDERENVMSYILGMIAGRRYAEEAARRMEAKQAGENSGSLTA